MNDDPVIKLKACKYSDIPKNVKVINASEMEYYIWVYLDPEYIRDCYLYEVTECEDGCNRRTWPHAFKHESLCWVKAQTSLMNMDIGQHTYKLSFVNRSTDATFSVYISYIVQNDRPDKPYIYMKDR